MKKALLFGIIIMMCASLFAQKSTPAGGTDNAAPHETHVTPAQALNVGYAFMRTGNGTKSSYVSKQTMQLVYTGQTHDSLTGITTDCYYVFALQPKGFVIVAADDRVEPILGFSYDNDFAVAAMPDHVRAWLGGYERQIEAVTKSNLQAEPATQTKWTRLKNGQAMSSAKSGGTTVGPLLTTTWDQGQYYNSLCPTDASGQTGHVYTGCVATAMAQIIHYWGYPAHGRGTHSYESNYGTLTVNYANANYDHTLMPDALTSTSSQQEVDAVATLMRDCGVAVNMGYGPSESGSLDQDARAALINFFRYSPNLSFAEKTYFSESEWNAMLHADLDNNRPVYYSGQGSGGHAFVCDGYDADGYYHFNFGWGGFADGWFLTSSLTPGGSNFSSSQAALFGIVPDSTGNIILGQTQGTSTFTVDESLEFYHLMGHNAYEGGNYENSCNSTVNFVPANSTNQIVADILDYEDQSIAFFDGNGSVLRNLYGGGDNDLSPVVSNQNALNIAYSGNLYYAGFKLSISQTNPNECRMVSNIIYVIEDITTVHLTWRENGTATQWQIEYGVKDFALGTGTSYTATTNTVTFSNLQIFTDYDFYIRSVCGSNQYGPWNKISLTIDGPYWQDVITSQPTGYAYDAATNSVQISTVEELAWWAKTGNGVDGHLAADIDLSGYKWQPTALSNRNFNGHGHVLTNVYVKETDQGGCVFTECAEGFFLENLGITNSYIQSNSGAGGLSGGVSGIMRNCFVTHSTIDGGDFVGGLASGNGGLIINCYVNANVIGNRWTGLMVGQSGGNIRNCYAAGTVKIRSWCYIAGIVAYAEGGEITNCYSVPTQMGTVGHVGSTFIADTSTFAKTGSSFTLLTPVIIDDHVETELLSALNRGLQMYNDSMCCTWIADTGDVNSGYPVFGNKYVVQCQNPSDLSVQSVFISNENKVILNWTEHDNAPEWRIRYRRHDRPDTAFTYFTTTSNPDTIGGIPLGYSYDFNVRAICDANHQSGWSETQTSLIDLPYWTDIVTTQPAGYVEDSDGNVEIYSTEGLAWLAVKTNGFHGQQLNTFAGKTITLQADINLEGYRWYPIANNQWWDGFSGTFDGQNHNVSNIYTNGTCGLFGVGYMGRIKNIRLNGGTINNGSGSIIGFAMNCHEISNCHSSATVYSTNTYSMGTSLIFTGSICGFAQNTSMFNCSSSGTVYGREGCGNLIGIVYGGSIRNCFATGNVNITSGGAYDNAWYRGGLMGYVRGALVENCFSTGSVEIENSNWYGKVIGALDQGPHIHYLYGQDNVNEGWGLLGSSIEDISNATNFHHNGNSNLLLDPISINGTTYSNLLDALNAWVTLQNDPTLRTWVLDSNTGYPMFDDYFVPSCYNPSNLTVSQATVVGDVTIKTRLEWEQDGNPDHWEMRYVSAGHSVDSGTVIPVHSNPCVLTNLPIGQALDFYVRAVCDGENTSDWCGPVTYMPDILHWTDVVTTKPEGFQRDTEGNIYISSAEGLSWLSSVTNGLNGAQEGNLYDKQVFLTNDIDLSAYRWTPITLYALTLNGNNHVITGLHCNEFAGYQGLVGSMSWGTVSNIVLTQCNVHGKRTTTGNGTSGSIGGIVGYGNPGSVFNCMVTGNVNGGGIAGSVIGSYSAIENCCFIGADVFDGQPVGICESPLMAEVTNCYVVNTPSRYYVGEDGNSEFTGSGNNWTLSNPTYMNGAFHSDLLEVLNTWVDNNNTDGRYRRWVADTATVNGGYPIFEGTPAVVAQDTVMAVGYYTWHGRVFVSDTVLTDTLSTLSDYDSIVTYHIFITPTPHTILSADTCVSYTLNGQIYYETGDYVQTFPASNGGDSLVVLYLTIHQPNSSVDVQLACESFTWIDEITYTESNNTATYTLTNVAGCDSVVTLNLTIGHPNSSDTTAIACDRFDWYEHHNLTESGDYTHTFTSVFGCDSVVTLHLTINHPNTGDTTAIACDSFDWYEQTNLTKSGNYTRTVTNATGCDSVVTLHLTVNSSVTEFVEAAACDSYTWNDSVYTESGIYTQTFIAVNGCDSIVTLHLTANYSTQPTVATSTVSNITAYSATCGGNISANVCFTFTERGVCWSTSQNPTIADTHTSDGTGTGTYTSNITGLAPGATYYVRAYATHSEGTVYGEEVMFSTVNCMDEVELTPCTVDIAHTNSSRYTNGTGGLETLKIGSSNEITHVTDQDGNTYAVVQIGNQCWMAENLRTTRYADGSPSSGLTMTRSSAYTSQVNYYYNYAGGDVANVPTYGMLYNWYAAVGGSASDIVSNQGVQGVCPKGWHIPSWNELETMAITVGTTFWMPGASGNGAGKLAKGCEWTEWGYGNDYGSPANYDYSERNSSGFGALPAGHFYLGNYYDFGTNATFISSTLTQIYNENDAALNLNIDYQSPTLYKGQLYLSNGLSVRCLRNESTIVTLPTVTTNAVSDITATTATCGGDVTFDGEADVTERGVCWSTSQNPTVADAHTSDGTDTGIFSSSITNLTPNTTYYVRAYAANSAGTAYGEEVTFTTECNPMNVAITSDKTAICEGECATLYASGADNYIWSTGENSSTITDCPSNTTTYSVTGFDLYGCESVVTTQLTVNSVYQVSDGRTVCSYELPILWNGIEFSEAGTQSVTLTSTNDCDSVVTMTLTINTPVAEFVEATVCDSYTWNDSVYTQSGDYTQTFTAANGCDSVVTLLLTVNHSNSGDTTAIVCGSFDWYEHTNLTQSGSYTHTFTTANGCDSVVTLHLTINPNPEVAITGNTTICPGSGTMLTATGADSYVWSNNSTNTFILVNMPNVYSVTGSTSAGCSNTATVTISVIQPPVITITGDLDLCAGNTGSITAHGGVSYLWSNGSTDSTLTVSNAGSWQVIGYGENGCNSMVSATVNVWQPTTTDFTVNTCDSYTWNNSVYTMSGDYTQNLQTIHGCDSVVTLHLTVNPSYHKELHISACDSYEWNGVTYSASGDYIQNFIAVNGCDSVVTLHLTVNTSYHSEQTAVACGQYVWRDSTYTTSGDYSITYTTETGCDSIFTLHLTINPIPEVVITGNTTICPGGSTTLTATGADSYMWSNYSTDASIPVNTFGVYSVMGATSAGCFNTTTVTVVVAQTPVITISGDLDLCAGNTGTITAHGGSTYLWNNGSTDSTLTLSGAGSWQVIGYDENGCSGTGSATVNVWQPKASNFTITACNSYTWNDSVYTQSGDYTQTFIAANGCDSIVTLHLTILPAPTVTISGNTNICESEPVTLTANVEANGFTPENLHYTWYESGQIRDNMTYGLGDHNEYIEYWYPRYEPYRFSVEVTYGADLPCVTLSGDYLVYVHPQVETPVVTVDHTSIYEGGEITLSITNPDLDPTTSYQWYRNGAVILGATQATIVDYPTTVGGETTDYVYTVEVSHFLSGCASAISAPTVVTVNATPVAIVTAANTVLCEGNSTTLHVNVTPTNNAYSYQWFEDGSLIPGATSADYVVSEPARDMAYNFAVAVSASGGLDILVSAPAITVVPAPIVVAFATGTIFCEGGSTTLYANVTPNQDATYIWYKNGVETALYTPSITVTEGGTYTVEATVNGCSALAEPITVTVEENPQLHLSATENDICVGGHTTIIADVVNWSDGNIFYSWSDSYAHGSAYDFSPEQSGSHTITVTATNTAYGCQGTNSITVNVNNLPETPVVTVNQATVFDGSQVTLSVTNPIPNAIYTWYRNGQLIPYVNQTSFIDYPMTIDGEATVYTYAVVAALYNSGCVSAISDNTEVTVFPTPMANVTVSGSTIFCEGSSVTLHVDVTPYNGPSYSYQWYEDGTLIPGATSADYVVTGPARTTPYNYFVVVSANGSYSVTAYAPAVTVVSSPTVVATISESTVCAGGTTTLTALVSGGVAGINGLNNYSFQWFRNANSTTELVGTDYSYTTTGDEPAGTYTYWVAISNGYSCNSQSESVMFTVENDPTVTITPAAGYNETVCDGGSAVLQANATGGFGELSYQWYKNGLVLIGETTQTLAINNLYFGVNDTYTVAVTQTGSGCAAISASQGVNVNALSYTTLHKISCEDYTWDGITYTQTGEYTQTFTGANGCDSVVTLHLTINYSNTGDTSAVANDRFDWYEHTYLTMSGDYTHVFTNQSGCDSVVTLHLTVNDPTISVQDTVMTDGYFIWHGMVFTSDTVLTERIPVLNGYDSLVVYHIFVTPTPLTVLTVDTCDSYTLNGQTYTESGDYIQTFPISSGMDSVVVLYLTIFPADSTEFAETACEFFTWEGTTYTASGDYTQTFTNANGCDSVVTLHLTISPADSTEFSEIACESFTWEGSTYTASGDYTLTFTNVNDCDSVVTLHLTVNHGTHNVETETACESFMWHGTEYTASGTYTYEYTNASGCTSVDTLMLTVNHGTHNVETETACESFMWHGTEYTTSGTYTYEYTNANGCSSVDTLHLSINHAVSSEITVATEDSCYIWNDQNYCESGDYTQTLTAANGCDSVVTLHLTVSVGIDNYDGFDFKVYPNPTIGVVNVQFTNHNSPITQIHVFDAYGKLVDVVETRHGTSLQTLRIDLSGFASGVYYVKAVAGGNVVAVRKVVKR